MQFFCMLYKYVISAYWDHMNVSKAVWDLYTVAVWHWLYETVVSYSLSYM